MLLQERILILFRHILPSSLLPQRRSIFSAMMILHSVCPPRIVILERQYRRTENTCRESNCRRAGSNFSWKPYQRHFISGKHCFHNERRSPTQTLISLYSSTTQPGLLLSPPTALSMPPISALSTEDQNADFVDPPATHDPAFDADSYEQPPPPVPALGERHVVDEDQPAALTTEQKAEAAEALRCSSMFKYCSDESLANVVTHMRREEFSEGEVRSSLSNICCGVALLFGIKDSYPMPVFFFFLFLHTLAHAQFAISALPRALWYSSTLAMQALHGGFLLPRPWRFSHFGMRPPIDFILQFMLNNIKTQYIL